MLLCGGTTPTASSDVLILAPQGEIYTRTFTFFLELFLTLFVTLMITLIASLPATLFLTLPVTLMITLIGGREMTLFLALLVTLMTTLIFDRAQVPTIKTADSSHHEERHPDSPGMAVLRDADVHHHAHAPSVLVRHPLHGGAERRVTLLGGDDI